MNQSPMNYYVAFFRAVNVGRRQVNMGQLRAELESLGLRNVSTYIASGNALFEADETDTAVLERRIEERLQDAFGFDVPTLIRPATDLPALAAADPFGAAAAHADAIVYVAFLRDAPTADSLAGLQAYESEIDTLHLDGRHLFWLRRRDLGESAISNDRIERALGTTSTVRNTSTLRKMVDKYKPAAPDKPDSA